MFLSKNWFSFYPFHKGVAMESTVFTIVSNSVFYDIVLFFVSLCVMAEIRIYLQPQP